MGSPVLALLELSDAERAELISLAARRKTAHALALRARIVLTCSEGVHNNAEGAKRGSNRQTVGKWRRRFVEHCVDGLYDETWSGTPRTIDDAQLETRQRRAATHQRSGARRLRRGIRRGNGTGRKAQSLCLFFQALLKCFGLRWHQPCLSGKYDRNRPDP